MSCGGARPEGSSDLTRMASRPRLAPEILAERRSSGIWEQDLRVPPDLSCWPGHFPGLQVVPGVLQLDWVMAVASRWPGQRTRLARIEALKFRQPILAGQTLTLRLELEASGQRFRFHLADGATVFSLGRWSSSESSTSGNRVARTRDARTEARSAPEYPSVAELVPHTGGMVLLHEVLDHRSDQTVCAARIDAGALFRDASGAVPAWIGLEYMAQCIAVQGGLDGRAWGEPPRIGLLLGSRLVKLHVPCFHPGQDLVITVRRVLGGSTGMVVFDCTIEDRAGGSLLAEARLNCVLLGTDERVRKS